MTGSETDIQWFIARDGKQHGPVSDVELKKLMELAHLKPTDLVWRQGFSDWRTAASVFPAIVEAPRPAPPAPAPAPAAPKAPSAAGPAQKPGGPASSAAQGPGPSLQAVPQNKGPAGQPIQPQLSTGYPRHPGAAAPAQSAPGSGDPRRAGPGPGLGEARPDQLGTRTLGNAPRAAAPGGPRLAPDTRIAPAPGPSTRHDGAPPARRRKAPLVAVGLLLMGGVGAWLGSQYTDEIFAFVQSENGESSGDSDIATANLAPQADERETAAPQSVAAPTPTLQDVDRTLQGRKVWVSVKQEFPDWYQSRVADVARLSGEEKSEAEITAYLVNQLVQLRRENAKHALAASSPRHKDVAAAFLANLRELAREGGDGCYEFISRGEASSVIITRMQDPARSAQIEAQLVAVVAAIAEGRREPSQHAAPVKTDYDLLAGELGRLGWTQADMQLFANPKELAQAPRERVCSMLQDWFAAHLAIQDQASQERLLFETLKPVVSG